ncbi:MAG: hypothetical protein AAGA01_18705, partial [Cyanobacteria bacterium P01_E01_bin.43]
IAEIAENSDVVATADGFGQGGNVTFLVPTDDEGRTVFNLDRLFRIGSGRTEDSDLDFTSEFGAPGTISRSDSTPVEPVVVPDQIDPSDLVDRRCELIASGNASEFSVTGRGGLPTNPGTLLEESPLLEDLGPEPMPVEDDRSEQSLDDAALATNPPEFIQEPQDVLVAEDGSVYLYAETSAHEAVLAHGVAGCQPDS